MNKVRTHIRYSRSSWTKCFGVNRKISSQPHRFHSSPIHCYSILDRQTCSLSILLNRMEDFLNPHGFAMPAQVDPGQTYFPLVHVSPTILCQTNSMISMMINDMLFNEFRGIRSRCELVGESRLCSQVLTGINFSKIDWNVSQTMFVITSYAQFVSLLFDIVFAFPHNRTRNNNVLLLL